MVGTIGCKSLHIEEENLAGFCRLAILVKNPSLLALRNDAKDDYWISAYRERTGTLSSQKLWMPTPSWRRCLKKEGSVVSRLTVARCRAADHRSRFMGGWGIVGGHVSQTVSAGAVNIAKKNGYAFAFRRWRDASGYGTFEALCLLAQLCANLPLYLHLWHNFTSTGCRS